MGWLDPIKNKKEADIPARLRDKTPEQVAKELEDSDKLKNENELLKAAQREQEGKVTEIQTEFEKVKAQLAAAEANRNKPPDKDTRVEATPENILEKPAEVLNTRLAPLEAATIRNGATMARMVAQQQLDGADMASGGKDMNGRLFRAWSGEIDAEAKKYSPAQLMAPEAWLGIFWYLKGVHADELRDPEARKKKYAFLEPATSSAPGPNGHTESKKTGVEGLTDQEKHVADKMGVSYENYAKRKEKMQFVNV